MRRPTVISVGAIALLAISCHRQREPSAEVSVAPTCPPGGRPAAELQWFRENAQTLEGAAGLYSLSDSVLPDTVWEVRLRHHRWPPDDVKYLVRVRVDGASVSGDLVASWFVVSGPQPVYPGPCKSERVLDRTATCTADLGGAVSWAEVLAKLEGAQVWRLPDQSLLPRQRLVVDGGAVSVEVRQGHCYRVYSYGTPGGDEEEAEYRHAATLIGVIRATVEAWGPRRRR